MTLFGGLAVGVAAGRARAAWQCADRFGRKYRAATPFVLAIIALLFLSRRRVVTLTRTTY